MPKKANLRVLAKTTRLQKRMPKSPTENENPLTLPEPIPTTEEVAKSFERDSQEKREKIKTRRQKPTNAPSPILAVHLLTNRSDVKT